MKQNTIILILSFLCICEGIALVTFIGTKEEVSHEDCKKYADGKLDSLSFFVDTNYNIQYELDKLKKPKKDTE